VKRPKIVVVGSSNTDMVVKAARIPAPGETVLGGAFVMAAGGKGANQAVAAARLGAEVTLVARLGADPLGDEAVAGYHKDSILTDLIVRDPDRPTGVALILVDAHGENSITVALGANEALSPDDVDCAADRIRAADAVVMQLEVPLAAVERAATIARAAGVPVILDPAPAPDGGLPAALLRNVTCLKPNESEAERLTGISVSDLASAERAARALQGLGPRTVIITLGSQGALVVDEAAVHHVPAYRVTAVDTTAAGDAFTGAFATAVGAGTALEEAVRRAAAAGALAATRMGAQPSLPTRDEWEAFLGLDS
jgi:ribokinase